MEVIELLQNSGVEACAAEIEPVLAARRTAALNDNYWSLQSLTLRAILRTNWAEDQKVGNPFQKLPNAILLKILEECWAGFADSSTELSPSQWRLIELVLQAARVTKINLMPWRLVQNIHQIEQLVQRHCPELRELTLRNLKDGPHRSFLLRISWVYFPQPIDRGFFAMKNLRVLRAMSLFEPQTLQMASENLINLEVLEFTIHESHFKEITVLAKILTLKELYVNSQISKESRLKRDLSKTEVVDTMLQLVQLLPGLKALGSSELMLPEIGAKFLAQFIRTSPARALLLDGLTLYGSFFVNEAIDAWPENLSIRRLQLSELEGPLIEWVLRQQVPNEQLRVLDIRSVEPCTIHSLLESALAKNITHVILNDPRSAVVRDCFDLSAALATVPHVKEFWYYENILQVVTNPKTNIKAEFFKKMRDFKVGGLYLEHDEDKIRLYEFYKLFLLGSEAYDELETSWWDLNFILQTLQENPSAGVRIRKFIIIGADKKDNNFKKMLIAAALLMLRSPWMNTIEIAQGREEDFANCLDGDELKWFRDLVAAFNIKIKYKNFMSDAILKYVPRGAEICRNAWWSDYDKQ